MEMSPVSSLLIVSEDDHLASLLTRIMSGCIGTIYDVSVGSPYVFVQLQITLLGLQIAFRSNEILKKFTVLTPQNLEIVQSMIVHS